VAVVIGRPARRYAARAAKVQALLQDRRDRVLLQDALVAPAKQAHRAGEDAFGYGWLHARLDQPGAGPGAEPDGRSGRRFAARWQRLNRRAARWPADARPVGPDLPR
jgi:hypothetical protein